MKMKDLLATPVGVVLTAAVVRNPNLEIETPEIAKKLKKFADENGFQVEDIFCATVNWLAIACEDIISPPTDVN